MKIYVVVDGWFKEMEIDQGAFDQGMNHIEIIVPAFVLPITHRTAMCQYNTTVVKLVCEFNGERAKCNGYPIFRHVT